jgi:predicted enzyme related to lactoylglutathione lyase
VVSRLTLILDCCDAERLSSFWAEALGYTSRGRFGQCWPLLPDASSSEPWLVLQQVSEPKSGKNRMHLDIKVDDLDEEARRLEAIGARRVSDTMTGTRDSAWFVMADPEGNEFCIVRHGGPRTAAEEEGP